MRQLLLVVALAGAVLLPSEALTQSGPHGLALKDAAEAVATVRPANAPINAYLRGLTNVASAPEAPEEAYPYFARRQVTDCSDCHVAIPKLNTYGRLVKYTGYELPELDLSELSEPALWKATRYIPIAFRTIFDVANDDPNAVTAGLDVRAVQVLSGGALWGNRLSWWMHTHLVENDEWVNPFNNTPHELWGQYNLKFAGDRTRVSLRAGMSELPLWFAPAKTRLSEMPYAIYDAVLGENGFTLSTPQSGLMLHGAGLDEVGSDLTYSWALAAVNGQGDFDSARLTQLFGRFTKVLPNAAFGVFGFVGSQDLPEAGAHAHEGEGEAEELTDRMFRVGIELDANVNSWNIYALGLYGRNGNPMAMDDGTAESYYGGFIGADLSVGERLVLSSRYDAVRFNTSGMVMGGGDDGDAHDDTDTGGGHAHGEIVMANTDALVLGIHYLVTPQIRLTTELRSAFSGGMKDKLIAGLQFAF